MYQEIKAKLAQLEKQMSEPETFNQADLLTKLAQEHAQIKKQVELIVKLESTEAKITENQELLATETDLELKDLINSELEQLSKDHAELKAQLEAELNPKDPNDSKNCIIEIRAGAGGDEAAIFAADLFRMYHSFSDGENYKIELISTNQIGIGGYKEIIFLVKGLNAYGWFKYEAGTHRVQRVPETEKQGRVHTSTATVVVLPEAEEVDIEINPQDIRIDTFCSSGPGGQSVNTTQSAIRITHLPTGLVVSCQDEKSQHQNKEKALQVLRSRLLALEQEKQQEHDSSERKDQIGQGKRADKIRTYNYPQDRITDHRFNLSFHNIDSIMAGELKPLITSLKEAHQESK